MSAKYETILVEKDAGITWVLFNRPDKRNAMSPQLHYEMDDVLTELATDPDTKVLILTGAGEAFSAGQDLKLYFREAAKDPKERARAAARVQSMALAQTVELPAPHHRDGQRLLFRRRLHPGLRLRHRHRGRRSDIRAFGGELGRDPRRHRELERRGDAEPARRHVLRHDRPAVRRQEGGGDQAGELFGAARAAQGGNRRARQAARRRRTRMRCAPPRRRSGPCAT